MFKHVLLPTDGTEFCEKAIAQGVEFARSLGARLTGLYVSMPFQVFTLDGVLVGDTEEEYERESRARAEQYLTPIRAAATAAGVPCDVISKTGDHPYKEIIKTAQERGCDVIFMASHARSGVAALLLGSESAKVISHTHIPVLIYR